MSMTYTDSNYTFTAATPERKYIKYLAQIAKYNSDGYEPTRKEVQVWLGDPDPTKPNDWNRKEARHAQRQARREGKEVPAWVPTLLKSRSNWGCSRWAAMHKAGLIRSERVGNTVRYQITADGLMLLHSVR